LECAPGAGQNQAAVLTVCRVVDVVDEAREVGGDVLEGLVLHQIHRLDPESFMKLSAFALS
jgi:hypothetical protein